MHYTTKIIIILLLFCSINSFSAAAQEMVWDFRSAPDTLGWTPAGKNIGLKNIKGQIQANSLTPPIYIASPSLLVFPEDYDTIIFRMKTNADGLGNIFWRTSVDNDFNPQKSVLFSLGKKDKYKTYFINIKSQKPSWTFRIDRIIINPSQFGSQAEFEYIKLIKGNLLTNTLSAWQEFLGPDGRDFVGYSINVTHSSAIFGQSINIYIFWIIILFLALSFAIGYLYKSMHGKQGFAAARDAFERSKKQTFILAVFLWVLLSLNADYNFMNLFWKNHATYTGKTLEQKRAINYGKDFYAFLEFAKEKLPQTPVDFGLVSSKYAANLPARIYLVPHIYTENKENDPPYLLVFDPSPDQLPKNEKYNVFAKLNDKAYILKRIK